MTRIMFSTVRCHACGNFIMLPPYERTLAEDGTVLRWHSKCLKEGPGAADYSQGYRDGYANARDIYERDTREAEEYRREEVA